ncbi:MAG: hypothetical protein H3C64_04170 [Candidatus Kuenenia stuttgartiensis]|nr:hypothetical protein [Candidatus Kuenenia stuttgartiensis]
MRNNSIHFIHPVDDTTNFLSEILYYLQENTEVDITLFRLKEPEDHTNVLKSIEQTSDATTIVFMGHGMSSALSGATVGTYSYGNFISEHALNVFKGKKVMLLTCRSNEYLKNYGRESRISAGIGFPNLVTDSYETLYPEENADRINGIIESDIAQFRILLVNIVKFSLRDFILRDLSFHQLFTRLKLRSQKALLEYYRMNPKRGLIPYGKMLYDLNDGLYYSDC